MYLRFKRVSVGQLSRTSALSQGRHRTESAVPDTEPSDEDNEAIGEITDLDSSPQ
jgi:hypothetical protein